jgi:hypothetical protein
MHVSRITAFGLVGIKSAIAFVGHFIRHRPHTLHRSGLIFDKLLSITGESKGQTFTQMPQAIHAT